MGAGQNVTSPKVRIWDIERGHNGKEALYGILTLDVDTLMGAGQMRINCQIPLVFRLLPGVHTRSC